MTYRYLEEIMKLWMLDANYYEWFGSTYALTCAETREDAIKTFLEHAEELWYSRDTLKEHIDDGTITVEESKENFVAIIDKG